LRGVARKTVRRSDRSRFERSIVDFRLRRIHIDYVSARLASEMIDGGAVVARSGSASETSIAQLR
jgi:hypothetical protein